MMRVCLLLVFLMIAIAGFGQLGQNTPLLRHSLVTKAEEYYNDKRYDSALIVYKQFLGEQKVDTAKDSLLRSEVFYKIGRMYRAYFYEPEHAEPYLDSSFQLQRILNTQNSIYFGKTLYELASINRSMGKFDFAMGFALKAILISDTHSDMRFRANCRIIIANINNSEGNYLMANKYYLEAIALLEESDPNSLLLTNYLNNLSVSYLRLKLYDSARYFVQRSLEINTKMDNHLGLANDLNTIAFLYMAQKKHVQAIPFLKQSLDIKQRIYGMEHPEVVIAIISFAKAYKEMHEFDTSLKYIQKGLVALIPDFKDENIHSYPIIDQMNNQLLAFLLMYEKSQVLDEMLKLKIDHRIIDLAIYNAEKADSLLELNRISFIRKGSKMHIREHFNSFYEFFLNSLFLKYKSEPNNELLSKIYRVIESNKALALMEDLKDYEIHHGFEIDSLLSREKTLQKQLTVNELAI
ncbi:MAG: tetratricopeptide repeat protein, partial [Cyclobacteriaceae bacterium]|nr:tetratricopeptide repeat protein [Cyclobacteriaceae bacterium]